MARVLYVRIDPADHQRTREAAHAARCSLQEFCRAAIADATERWAPPRLPPVAEACTDAEGIGSVADLRI